MALRPKPPRGRVTRSPVVIPLALSAVEGNPVASPAVSGRKETVANGVRDLLFISYRRHLVYPACPELRGEPRRAGSFPLVGARFSASPGAFCGTGIPACAPLPAGCSRCRFRTWGFEFAFLVRLRPRAPFVPAARP